MPSAMLRHWLVMLLGAPILAAIPAAHGDIYKFVDGNGHVYFSDRRLNSQYKLIQRTSKRAASYNGGAYRKNRQLHTPVIEELARRYRLDSALVHAVVTAESAYDAHAVSHKGAVGLMQLMPDTARRYGVADPRNPTENVRGGIRYLRDLLVQFRSVALALAAYNAGENAVARYGNKIPPFPETQRYVLKVLDYYRRLKSAT
jgi:soluble lytic murein transglycosylase-like protein